MEKLLHILNLPRRMRPNDRDDSQKHHHISKTLDKQTLLHRAAKAHDKIEDNSKNKLRLSAVH
ncbi:MAG: hypothetical protein K2F91_01180, partial [Muribaculaceae bacterium]|nr:hypothetical protein [Muribaculaceae bacterium]